MRYGEVKTQRVVVKGRFHGSVQATSLEVRWCRQADAGYLTASGLARFV